MSDQVFKDCRSLQDPLYRDLEGDHLYKVSEELSFRVKAGGVAVIANDEEGQVVFLVSEHDFSNFIEAYVSDRVDQAFASYGLKRNGK